MLTVNQLIEAINKSLAGIPGQSIEALTKKEIEAIKRAISSKGKNKNRLLKKCPSVLKDPMAFAAWQGIQPNAYKLSIAGQIMLQDQKAIVLRNKLVKIAFPSYLDIDKDNLTKLGAW